MRSSAIRLLSAQWWKAAMTSMRARRRHPRSPEGSDGQAPGARSIALQVPEPRPFHDKCVLQILETVDRTSPLQSSKRLARTMMPNISIASGPGDHSRTTGPARIERRPTVERRLESTESTSSSNGTRRHNCPCRRQRLCRKDHHALWSDRPGAMRRQCRRSCEGRFRFRWPDRLRTRRHIH